MFHVSFTRDSFIFVFQTKEYLFLSFSISKQWHPLFPVIAKVNSEGFSQEDLRSVNGRIDLLSEDGSDISISPVSSPEISDDESDDEAVASVWSSNLRRFEVRKFTSNVGANFEMGPEKNEKDFFQKFFPDHLVQRIVLETNNYATKMIAEKADPKWHPTTLAEMYAFLGIFVIFSIMQIPKFSIAWNTESYFGLPGVPDIMTRERFERLCRYFHVNDSQTNPPSGTAGHDKLHHIRCCQFSLYREL